MAILVGAGVYFLSTGNNKEISSDGQLRTAPDFDLKDFAGNTHHLSELRGNVVLLHFWASWCPPCLGEISQWVELAAEFKGHPIKMVAISLDEKWDAAQKVLPSDKLPPGILSLIDPQTKVSDLYGSYAFPETYLINSRGQIVTKWVGPQDWKKPEFLQLMDEMVKKSNSPEQLNHHG